jgi:hypothetical protein
LGQPFKSFLAGLQEFLKLAIPLGLGCALLAVPLVFVAGAKLAMAGSGGIFVMVISYRYPRQALWAFFIYMPFAGTVTYTLGGGNAIFQLAKDSLCFPAFLVMGLTYRQSREPFLAPKAILPALWAILVFCGLSLVLVSLPRQFLPVCSSALKASGQACKEGQPFLQGVLGLKVFMGYVPLIFCVQKLLRTMKEFLFFTRTHTILAIICCALCLVQLWMLQSGRCQGTDHLSGDDLFVANLEARCFVGGSLLYSPSQGVIRLPSTFVAPWQWGWFMIGNAYFTFASAFSDPSPLWRLIGLAGMGSVMAAAVVSGQRVALALAPVSFGILLVLTGQLTNIKRFVPIAVGAGAGGVVAWVMFQDLIVERVENFLGRWEASPADEMITHQFSFVWGNLNGQILGRGLGAGTNSCRIFGPTWLIETWFPKVLFEIGPIGLAIFLLFVTVLSYVAFNTYRSLKDKNLRSFGACFWVFILFISYQTYYYPLDVDPVAVYYWIMLGAVFSLPALDRQLQTQHNSLETEIANLSTEPDPALAKLKSGTSKSGRFVRIRPSPD